MATSNRKNDMSFRAVRGVILTEICGDSYLVRSGTVKQINETAAYFWKLFQNGTDENELIKASVSYYEIEDIMSLRKDIRELILSLLNSGLIERYTE